MSLDNHKNNSTGEAITSHDLYEHTYGIGTDPLTQFAIVFSALIHDVGHVGVPNFVLAEENPDLAERYVQKSIAEQHSVTVAWDLLMQPHFRNLRSYIYTTEEECVRFRQLLVNMVMATDIFDPDLKALRASRWEMAFGDEAGTDVALNIDRKATIVIEHVIQASDVSHTMQHWYIYKVSVLSTISMLKNNPHLTLFSLCARFRNGTNDFSKKCTQPMQKEERRRTRPKAGTGVKSGSLTTT